MSVSNRENSNHFEDDFARLNEKLSEQDNRDWSWLEDLPRFTGTPAAPPHPFERMRTSDYGSWRDNPNKLNKQSR